MKKTNEMLIDILQEMHNDYKELAGINFCTSLCTICNKITALQNELIINGE